MKIQQLFENNSGQMIVMMTGENNPDWGRDLMTYLPERSFVRNWKAFTDKLYEQFPLDYDGHEGIDTAYDAFYQWVPIEANDIDWKKFVQLSKGATEYITAGRYGDPADNADEDDEDGDTQMEFGVIVAVLPIRSVNGRLEKIK